MTIKMYPTSNILFFCLLFSLLVSCGGETKKEENVVLNKESDDDLSLPFDQRIKNHVERKIDITQGENYSLKVYEDHLNDDNKLDYVITINRFENALKKAKVENNVARSSELGFFGEHNYIVYYSSITNKFSDPIPFGSSPQRELGISFENISSDKHKDVLVDYSIRNSQFRKVFLFMNDKPIYAFHWQLYDGWGTDKLEAFCFEYGKGSYSDVKDIILRKATMKNISSTDDYYKITPEIECTDVLVKRFFFNSRDGKYYTPN